LQIGLLAHGLSMALMVRARLGLDPWDTFHQGIARRTGLSFGTVVIVTGAVVMLLWIPLRERPGVGTIGSVVVVGLAADASLAVLPNPSALWVRDDEPWGTGIRRGGRWTHCSTVLGTGAARRRPR
jgi:uncharacterized membrane protein YczE